MPILKHAHYLLVTLLLCNAGAMEVREGGGGGGTDSADR